MAMEKKLIEKDSFAEPEEVERDVLHHFVGREEMSELMKGFKIVRLELEEQDGEDKPHSIWLVKAIAYVFEIRNLNK